MNRPRKMKFKQGAASFYIVAFATLILMIIATSFAAIIIAEVTRTSNDDLAQSAYDSALAGVEDAKLAFYNYKNCEAQGAVGDKPDSIRKGDLSSCKSIVWFMENGLVDDDEINYKSCDMVSAMLGRIRFDEEDGTLLNDTEGTVIQESNNSGNNMMQAYTCVKINPTLRDYRGTLSSSQPMKVIRVQFADNLEGAPVKTDDIKKVKLSWFTDNNADFHKFNYSNFVNGEVTYPSSLALTKPAAPPTVYFGMMQTGQTFKIKDFDVTRGEGNNRRTNRGMLYFTPSDKKDDDTIWASEPNHETYEPSYDPDYEVEKGVYGANHVTVDGFLKSNDKTAWDENGKYKPNKPYAVYCPKEDGSMVGCSVIIDIPRPIIGEDGEDERNDDTFIFVFGYPYGEPETDFSLEFYCENDKVCNPNQTDVEVAEGEGEDVGEKNLAYLNAVQIGIDSTGRANDLFRRVEARLEGTDSFALSLMGPLELMGETGDNTESFKKVYNVITEHNF